MKNYNQYITESSYENTGDNVNWDSHLIFNVTTNNLIEIEQSLKNGANVNYQDDNKNTPLMWAAAYGDVKVIRYLIEEDANVNLKNKHGFTALDYAKKNFNKKAINYLQSILQENKNDEEFEKGDRVIVNGYDELFNKDTGTIIAIDKYGDYLVEFDTRRDLQIRDGYDMWEDKVLIDMSSDKRYYWVPSKFIKLINNISKYEYVDLIGVPSGEVIRIRKYRLKTLNRMGYLEYNNTIKGWIFLDEDVDDIRTITKT